MSIAIRLAMNKDKNTPLKVLEKLASDPNYNVRIAAREAIAQHPNTSLEVLEELAFDAEPKIKKAVALRSNLPITLIAKMATDRQIIAKKFLLRNRLFSENLLSILAQSSETKVLQMVALHPNTPISLLEKLATVPSAKSCVAQNPNVTTEILDQLAESDDKEVQLYVVKNHKITSRILTKLSFKSKGHKILIPIVEDANTPDKIKSKILEQLSKYSNFSIRKYVAKNKHTPQKILINWARSKSFHKLHPWIAENPSTPVIYLDKFSKRVDSTNILVGVAKNQNTPTLVLEYLSKKYKHGHYKKYHNGYYFQIDYQNQEILNAIAQNDNTPDCILKKLAKYYQYKKSIAQNLRASEETLNKASRFVGTEIYLLNHPNSSVTLIEEILSRKAVSLYVCDRKFVARHPKTPTPILEKLTQDQNIGVRDAAKYRLDQRNL